MRLIRRYPELAVVVSLIVLAVGYLVYYEVSLTQSIMATGLPDGKLTMAQSKSIDTIVKSSHLMMGWALAVIGASAFFLKLSIDRALPLGRLDFFVASIVVVGSVLSAAFGQFGNHLIAEMLSMDQFPIGHPVTRRVFAHQYVAMLGATALCSLQIVVFCWRLVGIGRT